MWSHKLKKGDSRYTPYGRKLVALTFWVLLILLLFPSYLSAQRIITPVDDIVQVIQDSPTETEFQIEPGSYQINQPIDVNRSISLVGISPTTSSLPTDIIIDGNDTYEDIIPNGDFEQASPNWEHNIDPPDPTDPSYSIVEENTLALSPTHLALFKGIEGTFLPDQIQQDFTFPLLQDTCSDIGYPEVWQDIPFTPVIIGMDDFFTQPIPFPLGTGPTGISYTESTMLSLTAALPAELPNLNYAKLRFDIMRSNDMVDINDIVEISATMGSETATVSIPLSIVSPMTWEPQSFDITPLIQQYNIGEIPTITIRITKFGTGTNIVYIDNFQVYLKFNSADLLIPIHCGDFDDLVCPGWTGVGNWSIEHDPVGIFTDRCMMLGPSPPGPRDVWIELYVKTEVFGGKPNDKLRFIFDGGIEPEEVFIETVPDVMEPLPLKYYNPSLIPMNENDKRLLLKVPVSLTDGLPHIFHLISEVTPSAVTPTSPDFNTTVFSIDDIRFLIGSFPYPIPPEPGYEIPNGDFESGNNGSWTLVTTPIPLPCRDISTIILPDGGHNAPSCVKLGGIPPAKISFYVKPVNLDSAQDSFKVWIDDENNPDKVICDSQNSGPLQSGVWNRVEQWLVPPLLNEGDNSFSIHLKSCILSPNIDSYILFDDFCVDPYGGLCPVVIPEEVCFQNAVQNPSFETDPDAFWNKNPTATLMGPIHCFNPALPEECILTEPPYTGMRAIRFSAIAPQLNFWLKILDAANDSESKLEVLIDNQNIKTINATENTYWDNYVHVIINDSDLLPFIDAPHTLKIQVSANECNKTPVQYLIDDICLGYKILLPGEDNEPCVHNLLLNPDFESGPAPWDTFPTGKQIIKNITSEAHTGLWYAQLTSPQLDTRELWQENIDIPPAAAKLQFNIRVKKGSAPEQTKLEVYWDTTSGSPAWTTDASAINEGDWQLVEDIPLPTTPNPHTLHFVYKNCRVSDSSRFMIDDIAFKIKDFPLIQVFPAGNLCIENLQLRKGSIGVLNMGGDSKVYRCFIGDQLDKGLEISTGGTATVAQSVIHGNSGDGIFNNGGTVAVYQSTIRSNSGVGVHSIGGSTYVLASLIWNNGGGLHGESPVVFVNGWNIIYPSDVSGATEEILNPFNPGDVSFRDTPWLGKLSVPLPAGETQANILAHIPVTLGTDITTSCSGSGIPVDFENEDRDTIGTQVSADEVIITGSDVIWAFCNISPVVPHEITGRARDIGIGDEFLVEVKIQGNSTLNDATLYLVPEEYITNITNAVNKLFQIEKLPSYLKVPVTIIGGDNQRGKSNFVIEQLCDSDTDGITFTTNGRARIYLRVGQILIGIGTIDEWRIQFPLSDTEFVVDTLPPQFKEEMFVSTARELVINDNDNVSPPSDFTYPPDWGPHTRAPKAWSDGTLDIQTLPTAQIFFNNGNYGIPPDTLDYTIQADYHDPYPVCDGVQREVEVSGFITNQSNVSATGIEPIIDLLLNAPIFPGFEDYRGFGSAFINLLTDIRYILEYSANPVVNYSINVSYQDIIAQWQWQNLAFGPDWHIRMKFGARDLSGNFLSLRDIAIQEALELWWMRDPVLIITSAPRFGEWTNNPQIQWKLIRSVSQRPINPEPCVPIYGIRVWARNMGTSVWTPVDVFSGGWGWIINRESMDKNTPIVFSGGGSITLNKIITDKNYCGAILMATLIGADESGNVQNIPVLLQNQISDSVVQSLSNIAIWKNPCKEIEVETTLGTDTWWNRCRNVSVDSLRVINYNLGERDFGSSQRVPLPLLENACDYRVEIKLNMGCILPSGFYGISDYGFDVQIYEDSNLLATRRITLLGGVKAAGLCFPADLIIIPPEDKTKMRIIGATPDKELLNKPPDRCKSDTEDRLGDEGSPYMGYRQRDVRYDFVVSAFFIDPVTGAEVTDFTPAKATVTIYPPPGDTGGYSPDGIVERVLTAPSQPKEEQKIKMFERE